VPAAELALAVDEASGAVDADGRALLEVTIADSVGRVRVRDELRH
jgi:hypothetical protein